MERFGWTFAPGDKVMQMENDYDKEVYNGDIGFVEGVDLDEGELTSSFDGRTITYAFGELDTLVPAYAATIHKSQGSEYPAVVIPVLTQHYSMLQRNLLYTGVTRGKQLVVLVGRPKAVAIAVKSASGRRALVEARRVAGADASHDRPLVVTRGDCRPGAVGQGSCDPRTPAPQLARTRSQTPALLRELNFGPTGAAMPPPHTRKGNRLYRYYVS